jgi:hypothetical protein
VPRYPRPQRIAGPFEVRINDTAEQIRQINDVQQHQRPEAGRRADLDGGSNVHAAAKMFRLRTTGSAPGQRQGWPLERQVSGKAGRSSGRSCRRTGVTASW